MLMDKPPRYDREIPRLSQTNSHIHMYHQPNHATTKMGSHSKISHNSTLHNHSAFGNNSTLNFYPHLLQPTRLSGVVGAESSNCSSKPSTRTSLKYTAAQSVAKNVSFYKSGDVHMQAFKVAISRRNFRTFDSLLEALSDRIPLPFGVRTISTPHGSHGISRLDEFEDGKSYVCSDKKTVKPLDLNAAKHPRPPWFISKPKTRTKAVAQLIRRPDADTYRVPLRLTQVKTPKKIVVVRNGEPNYRHTILLSRRTPQSFENIMDDVGEIFRMRVHKLYTTNGRKVESLQSLYLGPTVFVAAGREAFSPMEYRVKRVAIQDDRKDNLATEAQSNLNKERTPKELRKTKGRWRVSIVTSELPAAATDAHVTITVYGSKGNSGPILLNDATDVAFKSGNEDEFAVNVGAVGEIRKVRIAHDNSGKSPGWLCESLTLTDITTGEIVEFPCNRWLSRDEDDGEICREIPARGINKPDLPYATYVVAVTTGNLWNAGTTSNIHLTLFGDVGDSGPRLLQHAGKPQAQVKGTTDIYKLEAVSLGTLHRVVVGHNGQKEGEGWFLERIVIREDTPGSEEWVFPCDRWLDSGEDDGKIIRELYAESDIKFNTYLRSRSQTDKTKTDHMWELEKWKYQKGNHVVFVNQATEKALRVRSDAAIDGLGDPSHSSSTFEVLRRRDNIRVFENVGQPSFHLALDQNRTLGHGKGGPFCEFQVKIQSDRTVLLESCKYPGQHVTVDPGGKPADTRGHPNAPGKTFYVYVKGCFRHNSIIMLNTSPTQTLAITSSGDVVGTGRRTENDIGNVSVRSSNSEKQFVYFRVVKVAEGVRMFQSEKDPRRFLRIKDGECDGWGNGDVYCHFKVHKYKVGCYVTLQSMKNRGVFVGLNANGRARPTVDTGDTNTQFHPEIITFGERRKEVAEAWRTPEPSFVISTYDDVKQGTYRVVSPAKSKLSVKSSVTLQGREKSNTGPIDGDFRIYVTTGNLGTTETITLYVYGDKSSSGPITLGKGTEGGVFQCGQTDEFQANLSSIGEMKKIRVGVEETASDCQWRLKQVKMKDMNTNEIYRFKFNRWISRNKDDGATLRELPVVRQDGKPILPILRYFVLVRTSKESARLKPNRKSPGEISTQHEIYLCLYGKDGDSGRRYLLRKPVEFPEQAKQAEKPLFVPGQLDKFEIEAVSLGELTKCVISCPTSANTSSSASLAWLCDEIVVRESEGANDEYVFQSQNKWLGVKKVGAKPQVKLNLIEKREVKRKSIENTDFKEGDWKVAVTTGNHPDCGTSSNVMFYACDVDGTTSGPVFLGSGAKGLFLPGTTEHFKVNLAAIKNLHKIRLIHDNSGKDPSWFVDQIKLKRLSDSISHSLDVRKWLSNDKEPFQTCVEVPIPKPGTELTRVKRYQVIIYTGSILGSDTEANVFVTIFGEKGDTARRPLLKSLKHDTKFQESQVDLFEVEAVDLGELTKIEIGHDGVGHGNGWFLHKVIIKESPLSSKDYVFFCNRWLDDGQDDGKIVRVIQAEPPEEDNETVFTSEGKYKVVVKTGEQSSNEHFPDDASVTMVIYGEEGKTGEVLLQHEQKRDDNQKIQCFLPGQIDEFQIEVAEVGRIYKIRLSLESESNWNGWFVEEIILEESETKRRMIFNCNRWLSKVEDDQETIREFPVTRNSGDVLPVRLYHVCVATGNRPGASTDANVFLTLRGERGDTGRRKLLDGNFQRNATSLFTIEAVDLGKLSEVVVSHDGQGYGAGWFLEEITVKEDEFSTVEWVFPGHVWLDDHVGDCKTVRRLKLLGSYNVTNSDSELEKLTSPPSRETPAAHATLYDVTVTVDEVMAQGNGMVRLKGIVYGEKGSSDDFSLGDWRPGREKTFSGRVDVGAIGEIKKIRVEMEDSTLDLNIFLISVTLRSVTSSDFMSFNFQRRFRTQTGSIVKELPAISSGKPIEQLVNYLISVDLSSVGENIAKGNLQLKLSGSAGDTGFRTLFRSLDGLCATKRDGGYVFEHEAVDLQQLEHVALCYVTDDETDEGGWELGDITVKVAMPSNSYAGKPRTDLCYATTVNRTFDASSDDQHVYPLQSRKLTKSMTKIFNSVLDIDDCKSPVLNSDGLWRLSITTSTIEQTSLLDDITIEILGSLNSSDKITLSTFDFNEDEQNIRKKDREETRYRSLNLGNSLGDLYNLKISTNERCNVIIYKAKLKDLSSDQEYLTHLTAKERMEAKKNTDQGVITYNFPLLKPDQQPTQQHIYEVAVKTGDVPIADTDADVKINIIGTSGETGFRTLASLSKDPDSLFQRGKSDVFLMETVDVGEPRKVTVGHSGVGEGAGWFLDDVIISETRDQMKTDFMFPCYKWFDDSVDDKLTQRDIFISGTRLHQHDVDISSSKGNWTFHVLSKPEIIKLKELDILFTILMSGNRSRDLMCHVSEEHHVMDFRVDEDEGDLPSAGQDQPKMLKLRAQLEHPDEETKKIWPIKECWMSDNETGEKIRIVFDDAPAWEGSSRGYFREMAIVQSNADFTPVMDYYVIFYTGAQSHRQFQPTKIQCQLHGEDGSTGWRDIATTENAVGKFRPGRVDVFNVEAVCIGALKGVSVRIDGPGDQQWFVEKVKAKETYYNEEEYIFNCNRAILPDETVELVLSDNIFVYPSKQSSILRNTSSKPDTALTTKYTVAMLWEGLDAVLDAVTSADPLAKKIIPPTLSFQLHGKTGSSDIVSIELTEAEKQPNGKHQNKSEVSISNHTFGELVKIGVGFLQPAMPSVNFPWKCLLFKLSLRNTDTNQFYSFRPKHSFFTTASPSQHTGLNWLELATARPRQDPATIAQACDYVISVRTASNEDAGTDANVYVTLVGENGDSGKRWLMTPSSGEGGMIFRAGECTEFRISSFYLGDLVQVIIGHNGRDVNSGWLLEDVNVTSSLFSNKQFSFLCRKWLANLQEDTFIERTLNLHHVTNLEGDESRSLPPSAN